MRYLIFGVLFFSMAAALAQPADVRPDIPPEMDEEALAESIGSGANYYTFVPLHTGTSTLIIHNQSQHPNDILAVYDLGHKERTQRILTIKPSGSHHLSEASLENVDRVYFLSIQPFQVRSEKPLVMFGMKTRQFNTHMPDRRLELLPVDNILGKRLMVGVTSEGDVHHPVYGMKIGVLRREERSIMLYRGGSLPVMSN
jgi:hypothetical protein